MFMETVMAASCIKIAFLQPELFFFFIKVEGILNNSKYKSILVHNDQVSACKLKMTKNFTFQHDNESKHTPKLTQRCGFNHKKIRLESRPESN